ncbi:MAG: glycosyl hydrolase family protein [Lentisphaerae bacterium]|nr:glycosyl hydrolase family protein [Lentisphaerota bacterium]
MEHAKSLLPAGKKWKLVWNDEFDGTELDMTKWSFRYHILQKRQMCLTDETASLDGKGNLVLSLMEKDGHYYCSQIQTGENYMDRPGQEFEKDGFAWPIDKFSEPKFMHKYGYYEIRCKLQTQEGWWSAFWLQSPVIGCCPNPEVAGVEVDIMESFRRDNTVSHNNHWGGYAADHKCAGSGDIPLEDTPDGYHTFGLEWTPDEYIYYVDGKETWRCSEAVSRREQFILVSTECMGYRWVDVLTGELQESSDKPAESLKKAVLPDAFIVDYVRVYDEVKD